VANYDHFNKELILRHATPDIISRGRSYFYSGRARVVAASRFRGIVSVQGGENEPYSVNLRWSVAGAEATCPCAYAQDDPRLVCEHKVAASLALEHYLRLHPRVSWQSVLDEALTSAAAKPASKTTRYAVVFSLQNRYGAWSVYVYTLNAALFDMDLVGDTAYLVETVLREQLSGKAKHSRAPIERGRFVNDVPDVRIAADLCWAYQQASSYSWNTSSTLHRLIPLLRDVPLFTGNEESPLKSALTVEETPGHLQLEMNRDEAGLHLRPIITKSNGETLAVVGSKMTFVSTSPAWVLHDNQLLSVEGQVSAIEPLLRASEIVIPPDEVNEFTNKYLAPLAARLPIAGDGFEWVDLDVRPQPRLYLKQSDLGDPIAELRFAYGDGGIMLGQNAARAESEVVHVPKDQSFVRVKRWIEVEDAAEQALTRHGLRKDHKSGEYTIRAGMSVLGFLMHQTPHLIESGFEIYGEENLSGARINRTMPKMSMNVSSGIDWFDVQIAVTFGEATAPLKALRQAIKKKERFIKLSDGSIGALPEEWIKKYSYVFSLGSEHEGEDGAPELRLQKHHAVLLGELLDEADQGEADAAFATTLHRLRDFSSIATHPLPQELEATLRPYQKHAFDWLHFLREYGAGGCIADDMGLGKTVQVLAFLQSQVEMLGKKRRPSLVVVPRSLIFNWQRESAKFTPSLKILEHADLNRTKSAKTFDDYDIVLTTYGILVRDIELLKDYKFGCAILDESQAIKNPAALSAKASRLIKAEQRITLTGTPVENSTQDLWSQFAFLNPGLLGTLEQFRTQFGAAIDRSQDEEKAAMLRRTVHPFILRRTKEQVAPELPPRTERIVYTEMEDEQRKVYDETKQYYQNLLLGIMANEGMSKARMKVLEGLLRLRQIANHPRLVDKAYTGRSAKFDELIDILLTLRSENHKVLIFSQFVQMLKLIEEELVKLDIPYEMLTGQTRDRESRVDSFQTNPDIPFFLISLKAGGVGLNLTAADYVIHVDPWWNPAVEMQATDRTHRIGQDKPIFIDKMIAQNTVEDKILQLQDRKRNVVRQVIAAEGGFFKSLTQDDITGLFQ
jgi:non-specific serine/threonine protein kinase